MKNPTYTIFQAFNWKLEDVIKNIEVIHNQGFNMIQISPLQQHKDANNPIWWLGYQISNFKIGNRLGNSEDLKQLCSISKKYDIKIIVDVVSNHAGNDGANKPYTPSSETDPKLLNNPGFWLTPFEINNWYDRYQVCYGNFGLPKFNTANKEFQKVVINYLYNLIICGVDGFRFDAAKHIPVEKHFNNDFWQTVIQSVNDFKNNCFMYGELLDLDTNLIDQYAQYINVGVNNRQGSNPNKKVIWNLSHDDILTFNVKNNKGWNTLLDEHEYLLKTNPLSHILYFPNDGMWREPRMKYINETYK